MHRGNTASCDSSQILLSKLSQAMCVPHPRADWSWTRDKYISFYGLFQALMLIISLDNS